MGTDLRHTQLQEKEAAEWYAARCVQTGDKIIIMCYAQMTPEEVKKNPPKVVFVDEDNKISRVARYEKHGKL